MINLDKMKELHPELYVQERLKALTLMVYTCMISVMILGIGGCFLANKVNVLKEESVKRDELIKQMASIVLELGEKYNNALVVGISDKDVYEEMKRRGNK